MMWQEIQTENDAICNFANGHYIEIIALMQGGDRFEFETEGSIFVA